MARDSVHSCHRYRVFVEPDAICASPGGDLYCLCPCACRLLLWRATHAGPFWHLRGNWRISAPRQVSLLAITILKSTPVFLTSGAFLLSSDRCGLVRAISRGSSHQCSSMAPIDDSLNS